MPDEMSFAIELEQRADYQFNVKFDWAGAAPLLVDEPAPLGQGAGPNAARLLAAAVGNCLSASLLFCIRKFKQDPGRVSTLVTTELKRNEQGRMRIGNVNVAIRLGQTQADIAHIERCIAQFEDFCLVTDSVRQGLPVHVSVIDAAGVEIFNDRTQRPETPTAQS